MSELPPPPSEDPLTKSDVLNNNAKDLSENPDTDDIDEEVTEQTKEKLRNLEKELNFSHFKTARREKVRPAGSTSTSSRLSDLETSTSTSSLLAPPELGSPTQLLPPAPTTSSSAKRRSGKNANADRRNTDIEFATEIGHHLLIEVRKLQTLLQEKDETIKQLEITKAEYERATELLQKQLRQTQDSEDRYKNEVWQLELTRQELDSRIVELETNLQKTTSEANRLAKHLNIAGEQIETLKATEETLTQNVESAKVKYETDMGVLRRNFAGAQREKGELQKKIEELQGELETANKRIKVNRVRNVIEEGAANELAENELGPDGQPTGFHTQDGDLPTATPPASPTRSPKRQVLEAETLKASLGHAHTMIDKLRTSLHREQTEKDQLKKLLDERQEEIENMRDEGLFDGNASTMSMSKKKSRGLRDEGRTSEAKNLKLSGGKKKSRARRPKGVVPPDGADSDDFGAGDPIDEEMRRNDIPFGTFGGIENDDDDDGDYYGSDGEALGISSPFDHFVKNRVLTDGLANDNQMRALSTELGNGAFEINKELVDVGVNTDPWDGKNPGTAVATDPMSPRPVDKITRAEAELLKDEAVKAAVAEALAKEREANTQPHAQRLAELQAQDTRRHTFGGDFSDLELEAAIGLGSPSSATGSNRGSLEAVALGGAAVAAATTPTIMTDAKARRSHEGPNGLTPPPPRPPTGPLTLRTNTAQRTPNYMPTKPFATNGQPEGSSTLRVEGRIARSSSIASASTVSTDASTDRRPSFHDMQTSNGRNELGATLGTNSDIIAAITQTMIGGNLYKYTRRTVGGGLSERRHKRFFWIHPYTKTLYWSTQEPGTEGANEKAKSAYIMAVEAVPDHSNSPPDLAKVSLLIKTPNREIKITAPTKQIHDMWFQSLTYLLSRSSDNQPAPNGNHADHSYDQSNGTEEPFGRSLRKKSSYNKISSIFTSRGRDLASSSRERAISPRPDGPTDMTPGMFDDEIRSDDERPENVFQCCDGKHDVSTLERDHHHHHQHHSHHFHAGKRFERLPSRS